MCQVQRTSNRITSTCDDRLMWPIRKTWRRQCCSNGTQPPMAPFNFPVLNIQCYFKTGKSNSLRKRKETDSLAKILWCGGLGRHASRTWMACFTNLDEHFARHSSAGLVAYRPSALKSQPLLVWRVCLVQHTSQTWTNIFHGAAAPTSSPTDPAA